MQRHVDALRASYEAFAAGDLEMALAIVDSGIEVSDHDRVLDTPKRYSGPEGIVQMATEAADAFDQHRYEPEGFHDLGDKVVVVVRRRGRGRASGIEVDERQWHLWEFRGDRAIRFQTFVAEDQASAAAGAPGGLQPNEDNS